MKIETLVYGIYPKSEKLRKSISRYERKKIGHEELELEFEAEKKEIIAKLLSSRITYFSDPILNWYDLFRPLVLLFDGIDLGQLTRYKETNTFYRLPIISDLGNDGLNYEELREGKENPPVSLFSSQSSEGHSAFFPGAHSFFSMSETRNGITEKEFSSYLVKKYTRLMADSGMKSAIIYDPVELGESTLEYLNPLVEKYPVLLVTTGRISPRNFEGLKAKLQSVVSDFEGENFSVATEYSRTPGIKMIDATNTLLESAETMRKELFEISENNSVDRAIVANTESFDFLPRQIADRKLALMSGLGE